MKYLNSLLLSIASGASLCGPVSAQSVNGTIDATITLSPACNVNGGIPTGSVNFGELDFGTHNSFFTQATTQLETGSGSAISITCSPGADATLTIGAGANDGLVPGSGRAMSDGTQYIGYDIFRDSGFTQPLPPNTPVTVTADGTEQLVPIHGRALGGTALAPTTYTDLINVTLAF